MTPPKSTDVSPADTDKKGNKQQKKNTYRQPAKRIRASDDEGEDSRFCVLKDMISSLSKRLDTLEKNTSDIKNQNSEIQNTSKDIEKSVDHVSCQILDVQNKIHTLDTEKKNMQLQIHVLNQKFDGFEKLQRKTCVEVRQVPKKEKETKKDLYDMIYKLKQFIEPQGNDQNTPMQLRDVYRLPSRTKAPNSTIIIEFTNTFDKETFLNNIKRYSKIKSDQLSSKHLGLGENKTPIYVSEYLTSNTKKTFYLAREFAKAGGYKYCWTSGGRVFLRKQDNAPHLLIKGEETLAALREQYNT